MFTGKEKQV